jgi:hypothetical protein
MQSFSKLQYTVIQNLFPRLFFPSLCTHLNCEVSRTQFYIKWMNCTYSCVRHVIENNRINCCVLTRFNVILIILRLVYFVQSVGNKCYLILNFELSPCSECCVLSFGWFPSAWILYADVLTRSVSSTFIGYTTYEDGTWQCVPKRWHIKFGRRGITRKKEYRCDLAYLPHEKMFNISS